MVDYHRHTFNLILNITLIYTFLISILFNTTDPNIFNQLRKGLDLGHNNFAPPQLNSSKIPPKPSSPSGSQPDSSSQLSHLITPSIGDSGIGGVPTIELKKKPNVGYSTEGLERILVYDYMPQGALSRHLFHWKNLKLEPFSWKRRLNIALDVARGMEYIHTLAHQSFIHQDLKSSNILLGDDFRAKVSDFELVKLVPDGGKSIMTQVAGTLRYVAPEYAGNYPFSSYIYVYICMYI
ncbi:putative protein kinase RLK-Pelle-LRR-IX family [Helianthus anomalus]